MRLSIQETAAALKKHSKNTISACQCWMVEKKTKGKFKEVRKRMVSKKKRQAQFFLTGGLIASLSSGTLVRHGRNWMKGTVAMSGEMFPLDCAGSSLEDIDIQHVGFPCSWEIPNILLGTWDLGQRFQQRLRFYWYLAFWLKWEQHRRTGPMKMQLVIWLILLNLLGYDSF